MNKMIVIKISEFDENGNCEIMLNCEDGRPWLTYHKGDLKPDPQEGNILNIRPPKILGYAHHSHL